MSNGIYGDTTRELYSVWSRCHRSEQQQQEQDAGEKKKFLDGVHPSSSSVTLPNAALQPLFNEIELYPSQSQIFEMVQCARECSNQMGKISGGDTSSNSSGESLKAAIVMAPNSNSNISNRASSTGRKNSLTFGEFCVFATELKKYYSNHDRDVQPKPFNQGSGGQHPGVSRYEKLRRNELRTQKSTASAYDVFLGGSCNPTNWRQENAIPYLKNHGITYYNPQQSNWVPEMIELEHQAKQTSQILFFVMNEMTRNVVSNIEASYLAGAHRRLIVVISHYPCPGHQICSDKISEAEYQDLNGALTTVHDLVERQGLPVFNDIQVALNCTSKVLRENVPIEDLGLRDQAQPVRLAHVQIGDKLVRLREAFDTLDTSHCGKISLADMKMAFRIHAHRDLSQRDLRQIVSAHDIMPKGKSNSLPLDQVLIDFDHFCCIISEFKNKGSKGSGEAHSGRCRGESARGKASHFIRNVFQPFHKLVHRFTSSSSLSSSSSALSSSSNPPPSSSRKANNSTVAPNLKRRGSHVRDVYLGGTMKASRWREKEAIPMLKKHGLTYFNPQVSSSSRSRRLIPIEAAAMDNSRVLLFVILGTSRSVSAMCEAAYYIGQGSSVVLCVQRIQEDTLIDGELLSKPALKDYNRGRSYLSDFANREGVPVFEEVHEAIECILQKCKSLK